MNEKSSSSIFFRTLPPPLQRWLSPIIARRKSRARIYIVPTRYGIWLAVTLLFMVLAGAVYGNNLVLIIAFFAVTLGVAAMLETHTRVLKIRVASVSGTSGFADEPFHFRVLLESTSSRDLDGVFIQIDNPYSTAFRDSYSEAHLLPAKTSTSVQVKGSPWPRGRHFLRKVRVITSHRMGLFTSWREFAVQAPFKSYPAKISALVPLVPSWSEEGESDGAHGFDFGGHRAYRNGDDVRRMDWKLFARRNQHEIKVFSEGGRPREELHWNDFPASLSLEQKLSFVSAWADAGLKKQMKLQFFAPFCQGGMVDDPISIFGALARVPAKEKEITAKSRWQRIKESTPFRLMVDMTKSPLPASGKPLVPRYQLLALTLFSSVCTLLESPRWLWVLSLLLSGLFLISRHRKWAIPSFGVKTIAIVLCGLFTFFEFHQLLGPEAGTCLLVLFTLMKFFEGESYRDSQHILILCLVLIASGALLNPNMTTTIQAVVGVWLCGYFFLKLHEPELTAVHSLRDSFLLLVTALPLTIALFFLFPRLSFQLFQPSDFSEQSKTGFSDGLDPGSVSDLVQSDDLQFRAYLDKPIPQRDLYWRGAVLHDQRGMKWKHGGVHVAVLNPQLAHPLRVPASERAQALPYRVVMQPHSQSWLFALDFSVRMMADAPDSRLQPIARADSIFEWPKTVNSQLVYRGQALVSGTSPESLTSKNTTSIRANPMIAQPSDDDQVYEDEEDPRFTQLITDLKGGGGDAHVLARRVLMYYRDQDFRYTLEPGINPHPTVSSFLFDWKRGFCEHYAGVTATLLRALDVPAHVVIGYQGGVWNSTSGHYTVTSRDAHAWLEAWDGKNWFRVDPTEVLTPLRLDVGGAAFFDLVKSGWKGKLDLVGYQNWLQSQSPFKHFLSDAQNWGESVSSRWNLFLLTYNYQMQLETLRELGIKTASRLFLLLGFVVVCGFFFVVMALWLRRSPLNRLEQRWFKIVRRLERASGVNLIQTGPLKIEDYVIHLPETERPPVLKFLAEYRVRKYGTMKKYSA